MYPCLGDPIVLQGHTVRIALKLTKLGGKMINPICLSLFVQAAVIPLVFQPWFGRSTLTTVLKHTYTSPLCLLVQAAVTPLVF